MFLHVSKNTEKIVAAKMKTEENILGKLCIDFFTSTLWSRREYESRGFQK